MLEIKRLRVFAGPNGSGKSTLFKKFSEKYSTGYFINADNLSAQLFKEGYIDLSAIGLKVSPEDLLIFNQTKSAQSLYKKAQQEGITISINLQENLLVDEVKENDGYTASFIASFIRHLHFKNSKSFSFETVMSHKGKLDEIKVAKLEGYKIYLYFVCIDDPDINISRVANRVKKGGHNVDSEKVKSRYYETLNNLFTAITLSDKSYLFDNSGQVQQLIAEIIDGKLTLNTDNPPEWFIEYVWPFLHQI